MTTAISKPNQVAPSSDGVKSFTSAKLSWAERLLGDQRLTHLQRNVGALLSFYINQATRDAWPSQARLAEVLGVTPRAVQMALTALETFGHLRIEVGKGRGNTNRYIPLFEQEMTEKDEQPFVLSEKTRIPVHENTNPGAIKHERPFVQNTLLNTLKNTREDSRSRSIDQIEMGDSPETKRETVIGDKKNRRPLIEFPDGFTLDHKLIAIAAEEGFNPQQAEHMFKKFESNHRSKASRFADWNYAWRGWVINQVGIDKLNPKASPVDRNYIDGRL